MVFDVPFEWVASSTWVLSNKRFRRVWQTLLCWIINIVRSKRFNIVNFICLLYNSRPEKCWCDSRSSQSCPNGWKLFARFMVTGRHMNGKEMPIAKYSPCNSFRFFYAYPNWRECSWLVLVFLNPLHMLHLPRRCPKESMTYRDQSHRVPFPILLSLIVSQMILVFPFCI